MSDYRITYKDGRTQTVSADRYGPAGQFFVFEFDGEDIFRVALSEVESVGLADIPEPEQP